MPLHTHIHIRRKEMDFDPRKSSPKKNKVGGTQREMEKMTKIYVVL